MVLNRLFDTHAHLLDRRLREMEEPCRGVERVLTLFEPGEDIKEYARLIRKDKICGSAGVHPHSAKKYDSLENELKEALELPGTVALGETGLDFHYMNSPARVQKDVFEKQLKIASNMGLPVIVHSREAFEETVEILDRHSPDSVLIHCFTGTKEEMREYIDRGFYIAVGGVVTFPSAEELAEAVKEIPLERLLLETDSPYMSPVPLRGKTNRPENIRHIAEKVGEIKKISSGKVAGITFENSLRFFKNR